MTKHVLPRAILAVRAEGENPAEVLAGLTKAVTDLKADADKRIADVQKVFDTFKSEHTEELKAAKKGLEDVVKTEKVEKINDAVGKIQAEVEKYNKEIDLLNEKVAALTVGPAGGDNAISPEAKAHKEAFTKFVRKGQEAGLRELEVKAAMSTDSDPDGGYVVPEEIDTAISRVLGKMSAMRSLATVQTMGTGTFKKTANLGGAGSGWVGEREQRPETATPQLAELAFDAKEVYANAGTTQTMLDDARIDIASFIVEEVSTQFQEEEGESFISGDGVAEPRGLLSYTNVANGSWAWGKVGYVQTGVATDLPASADFLIDLIHALKRGYRQNGAFLMNDLTVSRVRKLKDGTGNYLWQPSLQAGEPSQLMGYRVETDDNMPDIGAGAFPIAFGDFRRGYLIADRMGTRVLRDPYTKKPYVLFYVTKRVGAGIQDFEAIKLLRVAEG